MILIMRIFVGPAYAVVAPDEIKFFSELCYYGLSTLLGMSTSILYMPPY